jgi:hypothetical protein
MTGSSVLVNDINADQKEIKVASPEYFNVGTGNAISNLQQEKLKN